MTYIKILLSVILMFAGQRGALPEDQARLNGVAHELWAEAEAVQPPLVVSEYDGLGVLGTTLIMASVAGHESGFWSKVQDCSACWKGSPFCDRGRSVSLFQLHEGSGAWGQYSRTQICESNEIATRLAYQVLLRHRAASTPLALFKGYARGGRRQAAGEMYQMFARACQKAGVVMGWRDGSLRLTWAKNAKGAPIIGQADPPEGQEVEEVAIAD